MIFTYIYSIVVISKLFHIYFFVTPYKEAYDTGISVNMCIINTSI